MAGEEIEIVHEDGIFYAKVNGRNAASLMYKTEGDTFHIISTFTLAPYRGRGIASRLTRKAIEYAKNKGFRRLEYSCGFIKHWLTRHPEYASLFEQVRHRPLED